MRRESKFVFPKDKFNQAAFHESGAFKVQFAFIVLFATY